MFKPPPNLETGSEVGRVDHVQDQFFGEVNILGSLEYGEPENVTAFQQPSIQGLRPDAAQRIFKDRILVRFGLGINAGLIVCQRNRACQISLVVAGICPTFNAGRQHRLVLIAGVGFLPAIDGFDGLRRIEDHFQPGLVNVAATE